MDRIDFRRDKSKPMPKKEQSESIEGKGAVPLWPATFTREPTRMTPGRIVNVYGLNGQGPGFFVGPAIVGRAGEDGRISVVCFSTHRRSQDPGVQDAGHKTFWISKIRHVRDERTPDDWGMAWAWPQEFEQLKQEGWG